MQDLNDLAYFVKVVEHRGFAPAARALDMQKSKLSRRIGQLEERLGVQLIHRSSRRFSVTDIGQSYFQHCRAMLIEAEAAQQAIEAIRAEPAGLIRIACPPGLIAYRMGAAIADFMVAHPKIVVHLEAHNRPVNVVAEGFDIAIGTGSPRPDSANLVTRKLGEVSQLLVAAPRLFAGVVPSDPSGLADMPAVALANGAVARPAGGLRWSLTHADGATFEVRVEPRFVSDDLSALRAAALAGVGGAQMPNLMIEDDLAAGRLIVLAPQWRSPNIDVYAVFPAQRGLLPSMRALIDHLAGTCRPYRSGTDSAAG